jgi:hypothetical protein
MLDDFENVMRAEEVPEDTRRRVLNRLVWGRPEGYRASVDPDAKAWRALDGES